ncbi:MAG: ATP-binding cassette domain-containing protein [Negativicutes bacterium]|jgi:phospholipid/cholesterol/gamma-HCH transport system ATP-binding protein
MIKLTDINMTFGTRQVLKNINIHIKKGETWALIGGSGSGKTTIIRIIVGLLKPTRGEVLVEGDAIIGASEKKLNQIRRKMTMIFQYSALFDFLSVGENVAFTLRRDHEPEPKIKATVQRMLDLVGLGHTVNMMTGELSGGMKKRVGIARGIAANPKIILYDEPTSGLDPVTTAGIDRLISSIQKELGTTSVVVTHDMHSAYRIADKIAFLYQGDLLQIGTPQEIQNSKIPLVQQFINGLDYLPDIKEDDDGV